MSNKTALLRRQSRRYRESRDSFAIDNNYATDNSDLKNRNQNNQVHELELNTNFQNNALSVPVLRQDLIPTSIPVIDNEIPSTPPSKPKRSIPLLILAYLLGIIGIGINGWFSYSRGSTEVDRAIFLGLGFILEAIMFYLPTQTSNLWKGRRYGSFVLSCFVCVFLFVFAVTNSLGFASLNLQEVSTARAERITPAVSDASRRLDTLTASRAVECVKRGDRCRQLEKEEKDAMEALREARERVVQMADPQVMSAAKLVSWVSLGRYTPTVDDFVMLRLLLLTLLPQLGGIVLMLALRP